MIKAQIKQGNNSVIEATGNIPELLGDVAVLVGSIYTQFKNVDSASALQFRTGIISMICDTRGPAWQPQGNQTGIIFPKPEQED